LGIGFGVAVGVALAITAPWITRIFTTDQTVIDYATVAIIVGALFQPVAGYVFLLDGVLIGAGRGRYLAVAGIVNLVVYAPLLWVIAHSATLTARPSLAAHQGRSIGNRQWPVNHRARAAALHQRDGTAGRFLCLPNFLGLGRRSDNLVER